MKNFTSTHLRQKRKRLLKKLKSIEENMIRGSLIERYKQCGKTNCHCNEGSKHGPTYYLSVSIPDAKTVLIYVSMENKVIVEEALENYRKAQKIIGEISDINRELLLRKVNF